MLATINVLFHGLFFFEKKKDDVTGMVFLEVKAPSLADHDLFGGVRGNLINLNNQKNIDWRDAGFQAGSPQPSVPGTAPIPGDVQPTMLQFSRDVKVTGTGNLQSDVSLYKGIIKLPWPKEFFSRRLGLLPVFKQGSLVGDNIEKLCKRGGSNTQLGITTGVKYDYELRFPPLLAWNLNINIHFYFQPPVGHTVDDVNQDLINASKIFEFPNKFDIQIDKIKTSSTAIPIGTGSFRSGINPEDEVDLSETLFSVSQTPISTAIDLNKLAACLQQQELEHHLSNIQNEGQTAFLALVMISSANCPSFYVG